LITDNYYYLSELEIGTRYSIILVATTGTENINLETESDMVILKTGGQALASRNVATEPWFIGLMVSIALLLIILINVCVLVRERGGKYSGNYKINLKSQCFSLNLNLDFFSVQEKEPFQNQMDGSEGPGFDEFQKNGMSQAPIITGPSQHFFDERQYRDDDESMAEYGNGENGKFNEDGSFIGLYSRERVQTYVVQYNQPAPPNPANADDGSKPHTTFV